MMALPNLLKLLHENQATSSVIVIGKSFSSIILYFFGHCFVKKNDRHSNSHKWCNPSPSQNATVRARKGDTLLSIPLALAATLRVLFHSRTKPLAIKDLLYEHQALPDWIPSSFQKFYWEGQGGTLLQNIASCTRAIALTNLLHLAWSS